MFSFVLHAVTVVRGRETLVLGPQPVHARTLRTPLVGYEVRVPLVYFFPYSFHSLSLSLSLCLSRFLSFSFSLSLSLSLAISRSFYSLSLGYARSVSVLS